MHSNRVTFFSITTVLLIRHGIEERLPIKIDAKTGVSYATNLFFRVHREMLLQICQDYNSLPDYRTLSVSEIRFFYGGLREGLKETTKPRGD